MSLPPTPGHPVTASVLITDPTSDHLLIVHPTKTDAPWQLPGGIVEAGESPLDAVRREVREELELDLDTQRCVLLAVEWMQANRAERRNRLTFLFTGPVLAPADADSIKLQRDELDDWRWVTRAGAASLLHPSIAGRVAGSLRAPGRAVYRETRHDPERTL